MCVGSEGKRCGEGEGRVWGCGEGVGGAVEVFRDV